MKKQHICEYGLLSVVLDTQQSKMMSYECHSDVIMDLTITVLSNFVQ